MTIINEMYDRGKTDMYSDRYIHRQTDRITDADDRYTVGVSNEMYV